MPPTTPEPDTPPTTDQTRPAHPDTSLCTPAIKEFAALSGTHKDTNPLITLEEASPGTHHRVDHEVSGDKPDTKRRQVHDRRDRAGRVRWTGSEAA
ncbi:hypothetical protein AB0L34_34520, partial [Micromonospora sp. NPDC052213]|uniref:hypothetical protein n=1 Tax=Micromonospora sp. NPDC052213 TaxID=3155812 RepID=UPI00341D79D7